MKLIEAVKSGKPFVRKQWIECGELLDGDYAIGIYQSGACYFHMLKEILRYVEAKDILEDDYELVGE